MSEKVDESSPSIIMRATVLSAGLFDCPLGGKEDELMLPAEQSWSRPCPKSRGKRICS